jgi:hypothetical protein
MTAGLPVPLLIAANAVPLVDASFLDWGVFKILLLFWSESVIIGWFGIARMIGADGSAMVPPDWRNRFSSCKCEHERLAG